MNKIKVFFRADGNSTIGLGHVYRSLALLQMLDDFFDCYFIIKDPSPEISTLISDKCKNLIVITSDLTLAAETQLLIAEHLKPTDYLVVDGYEFDIAYKKEILSSKIKLICIDDLYADHGGADLIINHGGGSAASKYPHYLNTQYCLGPKYALLRPPFWQFAQNKNEEISNGEALFICFGGADPENYTVNTLKLIGTDSTTKCHVVIGSAYQHKDVLDEFIRSSNLNIEISNNLSAEDMVVLMSTCNTAITSASTIAYEYLSTGGLLYLKQTADNQIHLYNYLIDNKLAFNVDEYPLIDDYKINESQIIQNNVFDGNQAKRLRNIFKSLILDTREAREADAYLYHEWTNDKTTRAQSFVQNSIPLENHLKWFDQKLKTDSTEMYVIELNNTPIGQVRFDLFDDYSIISYSLDKEYRGKGLGTAMLHRALVRYKLDHDQRHEIIGYVKKENIPSQKAFRLLEFKEQETDLYKDSYQYIYSHGV